MGVLRQVMQMLMLPMFHPGEQLTFGGTLAPQFIGDEHPRHVGQPLEQLAEELFRGPLVAPALYQDIQYVPILIDARHR